MEQGSKKWHEWRSKGIGASEVPIITGSSPHDTTIEELIQKKITPSLDLKVKEIPKYITDQAQNCEKKCMEVLNSKGFDFKPETFNHGIYPFLKASLDGWDEKTKTIIEVKLCKREYYEKVRDFEIPQHFLDQVLYQMYITNSFKAYLFAVLFDGKKFSIKTSALTPVQYDFKRTNLILHKVFETWREIVRRKAKIL